MHVLRPGLRGAAELGACRVGMKRLRPCPPAQVVAYFAPQFAELRRRVVQGGEASYVTSLTRCIRWAQRGGKSNAYFAKTRDDRFIIKSMSKVRP